MLNVPTQPPQYSERQKYRAQEKKRQVIYIYKNRERERNTKKKKKIYLI